jgi:hypothetical protein
MRGSRFTAGALVCLVACLLAVAGKVSGAGEFDATSVGDEAWQSREFEQTSMTQLLRASLQVVQDIGFQVSEAEREPGLLVAQSRGPGTPDAGHVLTVSVTPVRGEGDRFRVRASMAAHRSERQLSRYGQPDYGDFHQAFFNHLQRELFRSRSLK